MCSVCGWGGEGGATEMRGQPINLSRLVLNAHLLAIKIHHDDSSLARTLAWKSLRAFEHLLPAFCVWRERMEGWEGGGEKREGGGVRGRSEGWRSSKVAVVKRKDGGEGGGGGEEGRRRERR